MNFIINLLSTVRRSKVYNIILIIMNRFLKIVYYIICIKEINAFKLKERLIKKIFLKFKFFKSIINNKELMFTLKY